ncbi:MAG: GAF domain-containing protein [Anaerolineales bacterium]|nr:GAF domain-containing protein [Anaerolineales bacterium]
MAGKFPFTQAHNPEETTRMLYENWRERFVYPLLVGVLIFGAFVLISAVRSAENIALNSAFTVVYAIIALVTFVRFSYKVRIWAFLFSVYSIGVIELLRYSILGDSSLFFLGMIVIATMMLSPRAGILTTTASAVTCAVVGFLMQIAYISPLTDNLPAAKAEDWVSGTAAIVTFGVVVILGFQRLEKEILNAQKKIDATLSDLQDERAKLEEKVLERTVKLKRVNEIGRAITSILDPDELLSHAIGMIRDEFECYYVAIFFTDIAEQWANIKEATGDAGKVLRENKYRVEIKGKSLVGAAIRTRQVRIAEGAETGYIIQSDIPLLAYSRSQIAVPMAIGERIIGALEMQSTQENAFLQQDADTYQNMANEIAIAFENSRLFKEAQQSLTEMRATQRQYLQNAWSSLASEHRLEYSLGERGEDETQITVPLTLRDQIIGQIEMATSEEMPLEQRNLIEAIATQAALALENARLVEESQSIAARERLTNEITAKVWASPTMNGILQTTVRELGRALEAAEVVIELNASQRFDVNETKDNF